MKEQKIVVGLDIGTTKICAIVGRKNNKGKLEVLGKGESPSLGVVGGIVANIDKTADAISKAISEAEESANIDIKVVNVGISGEHIHGVLKKGGITRDKIDTEISFSDVSKLTSNMYKVLPPPGNKIIHMMPQTYYIDGGKEIKDPVGMSGVQLEGDFYAVTAKVEYLNNIAKCMAKNHLVAENIIFNPIASSISTLSKEEKEAGVCLIDMGGDTTEISVYCDSVLCFTTAIPYGGNIISEDIKQAFGIMPTQAELLKKKFGRALVNNHKEDNSCSKDSLKADVATARDLLKSKSSVDDYEKTNSHTNTSITKSDKIVSIPGIKNRNDKRISTYSLAAVIQARMGEIAEIVYDKIVQSGYRDRISGSMVLTGGCAIMPHIIDIFEHITGYDMRIGYPNECLEDNDEMSKKTEYATSIGLVLSGFRDINYIEDYKKSHHSIKENIEKSIKKPGNAFFKRIIEKTKGLLIGDLED